MKKILSLILMFFVLTAHADVKYSIEKWEAKTDIFTSKIGGGK